MILSYNLPEDTAYDTIVNMDYVDGIGNCSCVRERTLCVWFESLDSPIAMIIKPKNGQ
jgi:hypothetical protein